MMVFGFPIFDPALGHDTSESMQGLIILPHSTRQ